MSSRPRSTLRSTQSPLESLIYSLIPSLVPPSKYRPSSEIRSGRASVAAVSGSRPGIRADVQVEVDEEERERKERVRELMEWCEEIMERWVDIVSVSLARAPVQSSWRGSAVIHMLGD